MKKHFLTFLIALISSMAIARQGDGVTLAAGEQPQISIDSKGIVRVVFGRDDKIYCSTSMDKGNTYSEPALVAEVPKMHLGMTRGPQLASSKNYSVITAQDELGSIHCFKLKHAVSKWEEIQPVNDIKGSAPEGLMSIAADYNDNFYAVWLDIRIGKKNNIFFSALKAVEDKWSENVLAYKSPEGTVCGCCKPSIAVRNSKVVLMFRNWLAGSRDLYMMQSLNYGKTFSPARKLGMGTWVLEGCPMDGGGVSIDDAGNVHTAWQREGAVFYCKPSAREEKLAVGKSVSITLQQNLPVVMLQDKDGVKLISVENNQQKLIGSGSFLKSIQLPDNQMICVWEQDNKIMVKKV